MDLQNARLRVKSVEFENSEKVYVMEKSINLHMTCRSLMDLNGNKYDILFRSFNYLSDNKEYVEYHISFENQSLDFSIGTEFVQVDKWRLDIPDSRIVKIEYEAINGFPDFEEEDFKLKVYDSVKITVDIFGEVQLYKPVSEYLKKAQNVSFKIDNSCAEKLFNDLLRCISEVDCYYEWVCDDTGRELVFYFEDGTELHYEGVFYHGNVNTVEVLNAFVEKCRKIQPLKMNNIKIYF